MTPSPARLPASPDIGNGTVCKTANVWYRTYLSTTYLRNFENNASSPRRPGTMQNGARGRAENGHFFNKIGVQFSVPASPSPLERGNRLQQPIPLTQQRPPHEGANHDQNSPCAGALRHPSARGKFVPRLPQVAGNRPRRLPRPHLHSIEQAGGGLGRCGRSGAAPATAHPFEKSSRADHGGELLSIRRPIPDQRR